MTTKERSQEEILLRETIRRAIKISLNRRAKENQRRLLEEQTLRKVIRGMVVEAAKDDPVYNRTWKNHLTKYMKVNAPNILTAYQSLQTSAEQRSTFILVLKKAIQNMFQTIEAERKGIDDVEALTEKINEEIQAIIGDPIDEPGEDSEDEVEDPTVQFAEEIGLPIEKLSRAGLEAAKEVFSDYIEKQVPTIIAKYGEKDVEDFEGWLKSFEPTILDKLEATEELMPGGSVDKLIKDIESDDRDLDKPEQEVDPEVEPEVELEADPEEPPEVGETNEIVELEEYIDLDELLSNL
jgi:hypothetical protein